MAVLVMAQHLGILATLVAITVLRMLSGEDSEEAIVIIVAVVVMDAAINDFERVVSSKETAERKSLRHREGMQFPQMTCS